MTSPTPDLTTRVPFWRRPFRVVRDNLRVYLIVNAATYGLFAVGFVLGLVFPNLTAGREAALVDDGTADLVLSLVTVPPLFALMILAVNVFRLSLLTILLPSVIVPFAGLAFFAYWTVETGITLVPSTPEKWVALIPHSLTLIIELQAYVLLALGAYLLGRAWLWPRSVGASRRRSGYVWGLRKIGLLALPALVLLVVGAVWEAYSLRYLVHPLTVWLL